MIRIPFHSMATQTHKLLATKSCMRAREFRQHGIHSGALARMCALGFIQRVGRGIYELPNTDITENHGLVIVKQRVPHGIVCLLSALQFHGLSTQIPYEVWIAISRKAWRPKQNNPHIRFINMADMLLTHGVKRYRIEGNTISITTPPRTVADAFKFRNKIGIDVALEALRNYTHKRIGSINELLAAAKLVRVDNIMHPYIEALL